MNESFNCPSPPYLLALQRVKAALRQAFEGEEFPPAQSLEMTMMRSGIAQLINCDRLMQLEGGGSVLALVGLEALRLLNDKLTATAHTDRCIAILRTKPESL